MLAEQLERLTETHPDCLIAAFADLGSKVTLVNNSRVDTTRETLDELCNEAALTLGTATAPPLGSERCNLAVKTVGNAVFVYMRGEDEADDALICMCRSSISLDKFMSDAKAFMSNGG